MHATLAPSHTSALQRIASGLHGVPAAARRSVGQEAEAPVQSSATSHSPIAARQTTLDAPKRSAGQTDAVPSHCSATSHAPAAARQMLPALPAGCVQVPLPSQTSRVHVSRSGVHAVPGAAFVSIGQVAETPLQ